MWENLIGSVQENTRSEKDPGPGFSVVGKANLSIRSSPVPTFRVTGFSGKNPHESLKLETTRSLGLKTVGINSWVNISAEARVTVNRLIRGGFVVPWAVVDWKVRA
ncbi:hypothetical protein CDL12_04483 [Handroanthus impetiginosus]|uniref:Uncharacterized protein n=1 Tax=Handroanthus impetiginosus TaxID=429701 RepID=A0A2G9HZ69_9LAMI|nr:hypothetical protein CDL12_04483 [Handroanthus impetiginosus]